MRHRFNISAFDWLSQIECGAIPNAETGQALRARVEPIVRTVLAEHAGQNVAIICHGGIIRMILALLIDVPLSKMAAFEIDYASVTEVITNGSRAEIHLLNFTPWKKRD